MSVARFVADQRTSYAVPVAFTCALLGISISWFYKWIERAERPGAERGLFTTRDLRRDVIDRAVRVMFVKQRGLHGSPFGFKVWKLQQLKQGWRRIQTSLR